MSEEIKKHCITINIWVEAEDKQEAKEIVKEEMEYLVETFVPFTDFSIEENDYKPLAAFNDEENDNG
jgi:hypothetical protein